jgi:hypothetical protein
MHSVGVPTPPSDGFTSGWSRGAAVGDVLADAASEGVGDVLEAVEADAGVVAGLPALDLLLGDSEAFGERALARGR